MEQSRFSWAKPPTMNTAKYLKLLVDDIHSVVIATVDENGHPASRVIDMMYQDDQTAYFLTANTKNFYQQLRKNPFVSITGITQGTDTMKRKMVTVSGKVELLGKDMLPTLLENNPYMYDIYPTEEKRQVLEVFRFTKAQGEFYDLTVLPPFIEGFTINI